MIVSPEHFRYLLIQRGEVSDAYVTQGFEGWKQAYEASLRAIVRSMEPALPADARSILDVGGGLGGLGVFLSRRYPSAGYWVLDGASDRAEVRSHSKTFSNAVIAADFLRRNGVTEFGFYEPCDGFDRTFDLVVSTAAWGFHIPPSEYLSRVREALAPHATVILDVRSEKPEWFRELNAAFGDGVILETGKKHTRCAWQI
jgi:hypothetical protein